MTYKPRWHWLLALFVLSLTACAQWDAHAMAALTVRDSANAAKSAIRSARMDHMREAARAAQTSGGDTGTVSAAIDAAAAEWDADHADVISAHATFAAASTGYTAAVFGALRGEAGSADSVVSYGRQAIAAYNAIAEILRRRGFPELPELPPGIAEFLRVLLPSGGGQ